MINTESQTSIFVIFQQFTQKHWIKSENRSSYLLSTVIANNPYFKPNSSSLRGKRYLFIAQKPDLLWVIPKKSKIMHLKEQTSEVI